MPEKINILVEGRRNKTRPFYISSLKFMLSFNEEKGSCNAIPLSKEKGIALQRYMYY
jgi:hypothetical protein